MDKAIIALEDGTVFHGTSFGAPGERAGDELAQLDDLDALQRLFRAHNGLRSTTACASVPLSTYSS